MNEIIISILAFVCLVPFWDFTLNFENYLSLIPFIIYTSILIFAKKTFSKKKEMTSAVDSVSLTDIYKAFFLNFLFFTIFIFLFAGIVKLLEDIFAKNVLYFIFYVWFTQNAVITSPGFKLCKISIDRSSFKKTFSLLLYNLYKYSIFIFGLLSKELRESTIGTSILSIILIFYLMNLFYRFFISKRYSMVEHLLGIKYTKEIESYSKIDGNSKSL